MRTFFWVLAGLVATAAACAGALVFLLGPLETPGRDIVVLIRPGLAMPAIARELEADGLIRNAQAFTLLARLRGHTALAKAGEFQLNSGWTPREILRVITTTNGIQHHVVVREGLSWWAAAKLFETERLATRAEFEQAMTNATLLEKYGVPTASAEGFLFPETYQLPRTLSGGGVTVVEAMLREFDHVAKKLWPQGPPPGPELLRIVTLASLVERETGTPEERPRIAGVFMNRLRLGMRLQCDPTTIYGLGPDFDGNLKRADLEDAANPYNTYAHAGLPPGPICSPGLASLLAAMTPEENDYIFFVAKGDGTHAFSRTLEEHNRAVNLYQRHIDPGTYHSAPRGTKTAVAQAPEAKTPPAKTPAKPAAKKTTAKKPAPKKAGKGKPAAKAKSKVKERSKSS
ncbi:MAG: endolytic transglycosylase MltG [Humidesulfovibrio sp.]|nr:endolytic transglycosylase MltG [Humidesulfovibrio sp.]